MVSKTTFMHCKPSIKRKRNFLIDSNIKLFLKKKIIIEFLNWNDLIYAYNVISEYYTLFLKKKIIAVFIGVMKDHHNFQCYIRAVAQKHQHSNFVHNLNCKLKIFWNCVSCPSELCNLYNLSTQLESSNDPSIKERKNENVCNKSLLTASVYP